MVVIALSGSAGSGKTTIGKIIAEHFNLRFISIGSLFRELAMKHGLSLEEFHLIAEKDPKYDKQVDELAIREARKGNILIEGHLSCWILSNIADLKIYLHASLEERARRVSERDRISYEEAMEKIKKREESNKKRYKEIYGIDISDLSVMDFLINTSKFKKEEVAKILISVIEAYLSSKDVSVDNNRKAGC